MKRGLGDSSGEGKFLRTINSLLTSVTGYWRNWKFWLLSFWRIIVVSGSRPADMRHLWTRVALSAWKCKACGSVFHNISTCKSSTIRQEPRTNAPEATCSNDPALCTGCQAGARAAGQMRFSLVSTKLKDTWTPWQYLCAYLPGRLEAGGGQLGAH